MGEVVKAEFGKRGALRFDMTARQRKALAFIRARLASTGQWPPMIDIKAHLGLTSTIGTILVVQRLADLGVVSLPTSWPTGLTTP